MPPTMIDRIMAAVLEAAASQSLPATRDGDAVVVATGARGPRPRITVTVAANGVATVAQGRDWRHAVGPEMPAHELAAVAAAAVHAAAGGGQ